MKYWIIQEVLAISSDSALIIKDNCWLSSEIQKAIRKKMLVQETSEYQQPYR